MTIPRQIEGDHARRRRAVVRAFAAVTVQWVLIFTTYYIAPFGARGDVGVISRIIEAGLLLVVVLSWQYRRIVKAALPGLRAAEALAVTIPRFLAAFAGIHLSLSRVDDGAYSMKLNHTEALYFAVTVFATVGFGDITPTVDTTRLVVSVQMLLDLVILGAGVKVVTSAAKTGIARRQQQASGQGETPDDKQ